jgi:hypothetical protein
MIAAPAGAGIVESVRGSLRLPRYALAPSVLPRITETAFDLPSHEPEAGTMSNERRNIRVRAAVVQRVIDTVVQNPSVTLSVSTMEAWLGVPMEAAQRILQRLASSGLVREVQRGVWARGTWPGAQREWY